MILNGSNEVYSMGDDTLGQTGTNQIERSQGGPFPSVKISNPKKIPFFREIKIQKIFSNGDHNFAITASNELYGWGSNSHMQLGHELEYSKGTNAKLALFEPVNFTKELNQVNCSLQDIALGDKFSLFSCINSFSNQTEIYGMGTNIRGQLGNGFISHVSGL